MKTWNALIMISTICAILSCGEGDLNPSEGNSASSQSYSVDCQTDSSAWIEDRLAGKGRVTITAASSACDHNKGGSIGPVTFEASQEIDFHLVSENSVKLTVEGVERIYNASSTIYSYILGSWTTEFFENGYDCLETYTFDADRTRLERICRN